MDRRPSTQAAPDDIPEAAWLILDQAALGRYGELVCSTKVARAMYVFREPGCAMARMRRSAAGAADDYPSIVTVTSASARSSPAGGSAC